MAEPIGQKIANYAEKAVEWVKKKPKTAIAAAAALPLVDAALGHIPSTLVATGVVTAKTVADTALGTALAGAATVDAATGHTISGTAGAVLGTGFACAATIDAIAGYTLSGTAAAAAGTPGPIPPFI